MRTFIYKSLDDLIIYAESLGWIDTYPDGTDDDYDAYVTDAIEQECINFIQSMGFEVCCYDVDQQLR
tara:strand:- start:60 stop:260 length:201 start_codon:yes stop_codon:yes gene_type:complete